MAMDNYDDSPLYTALMSGGGPDPRQAGPVGGGPPYPTPPPVVISPAPPPNVPNPRPGGNSLWQQIKDAMPWSRLSQLGYGGGGPASGGGSPSPWGR